MAPGSAALTLKTAALVSTFTLLVVHSLGRCTHPPPPPPSPTPLPPPPAPTPAPGSGPTISCNDCFSQCYTPCDAAIASTKCNMECEGMEEACKSCKTTVFENCKADGTCTGSCDCKEVASSTCTSPCTSRYCDACKFGNRQQCGENCLTQCSAANCIP